MGKEIKGVELFATGVWNGYQVKKQTLDEIAASYQKFSTALRIPLKFGHNDEQPMTDGQPALGWVTNIRVEGEKLLGDFVDMPDIVYSAVKQKLYNTLSIELLFDVEYKGELFPHVLTAVALLGADLPAVNSIKDLSHYLDGNTVKGLKSSNEAVFSYKPVKEVSKMDELEKLQQRLSQVEARFSATEKANDDLLAENARLKQEAADAKAKFQAQQEQEKKMKFKTAKDAVMLTLEDLTKANIITPGQRDKFAAQIKEGDLDSVERVADVADTLKSDVDPAVFERGKRVMSKEKEGEQNELPADQIALRRIAEARQKHGLSFAAAKEQVFAADPKLAREYIALTAEV